MIITLITFLGQHFFNNFSQAYQHKKLELFSLKEQLQLEAHHHPSFIARLFFKWILSKLNQGFQLSDYLRFLGLNTSGVTLELHDIHHVIELLGLNHPVPYPFMQLLRLISLIYLPLLFPKSWGHDQFGATCLILCLILLCYNQYQWINYKVHLVIIFLWLKHPIQQCHFVETIPQPTFVYDKKQLSLWKKIFDLTHDLKKAAQMYASYYRHHELRQSQRSRKLLILLIDMLMLIFFWQLIDTTFSKLYGGSFEHLL
jgi:hypothetical protein